MNNIYIYLILYILSYNIKADYIIIEKCTNKLNNNLTLNYGECYKVPYVQEQNINIPCLYNENFLTNTSSVNDIFCPNCIESNYTNSVKLVYTNTIYSHFYIYNDLNCNNYIKNITFTLTNLIGNCANCYNYKTNTTYQISHTYVNTTNNIVINTNNITNNVSNIISDYTNSKTDNKYLSLLSIMIIPIFIIGICCLLIIICIVIVIVILFVLLCFIIVISILSSVSIGIILSSVIGIRRLKKDEYEILEQIGGGSGGIVYKGKYNNKIVAIKKIEMNDNENYIMNEIHIWQNLKDCDNIAKLIDYKVEDDNVYMISEFYENGDLGNYMRKEDLSIIEKLKIMMDISNGLKNLHNNNIIHRDISCRNVLLDKNKKAYITDFGFSRKFVMSDIEQMQNTLVKTIPVRWSAPESIKNNEFNYNSDIYMLSRTFYEIMSKDIPFSGLSLTDIMVGVVNDTIKIDYTGYGMSDNIVNMLEKMSEFESNKRMSIDNIIDILNVEINKDIYIGADEIVLNL